jgi:hypothetical protein
LVDGTPCRFMRYSIASDRCNSSRDDVVLDRERVSQIFFAMRGISLCSLVESSLFTFFQLLVASVDTAIACVESGSHRQKSALSRAGGKSLPVSSATLSPSDVMTATRFPSGDQTTRSFRSHAVTSIAVRARVTSVRFILPEIGEQMFIVRVFSLALAWLVSASRLARSEQFTKGS